MICGESGTPPRALSSERLEVTNIDAHSCAVITLPDLLRDIATCIPGPFVGFRRAKRHVQVMTFGEESEVGLI